MRLYGKLDGSITDKDAVLIRMPFTAVGWLGLGIPAAIWTPETKAVSSWTPEVGVAAAWTPQDVYPRFGEDLFGRDIFGRKSWTETDTEDAAWTPEMAQSADWTAQDRFKCFVVSCSCSGGFLDA